MDLLVPTWRPSVQTGEICHGFQHGLGMTVHIISLSFGDKANPDIALNEGSQLIGLHGM
jgi:hypothetical protein